MPAPSMKKCNGIGVSHADEPHYFQLTELCTDTSVDGVQQFSLTFSLDYPVFLDPERPFQLRLYQERTTIDERDDFYAIEVCFPRTVSSTAKAVFPIFVETNLMIYLEGSISTEGKVYTDCYNAPKFARPGMFGLENVHIVDKRIPGHTGSIVSQKRGAAA